MRRLDCAILTHGYLNNLSNETAETGAEGNAAPAAFRQLSTPSGRLRGDLQDVGRAWILFEQGKTIGEWIFFRGGCELVDKALDHKGPARNTDTSPPARLNRGG